MPTTIASMTTIATRTGRWARRAGRPVWGSSDGSWLLIAGDQACYFVAGGRLCQTVVSTGALDAVRSPTKATAPKPMMITTTAKKKIKLPSVERAGPGFGSGGGWYAMRTPSVGHSFRPAH